MILDYIPESKTIIVITTIFIVMYFVILIYLEYKCYFDSILNINKSSSSSKNKTSEDIYLEKNLPQIVSNFKKNLKKSINIALENQQYSKAHNIQEYEKLFDDFHNKVLIQNNISDIYTLTNKFKQYNQLIKS